MNSTTKGDNFEAKILELLMRASADGQFIGPPERCVFHRKKGYYSADRKSDIIFDIAVEYYLPGRSAYFLLILVECKDYSRRVPVDDAEEFFSKIEQVSGAKGVIVSTNAFAEGTFEYCKAKGIGLARYYDKSDLKWVLDRSPSSSTHTTADWVDIHTGLLNAAHESRYFDLYGHSGQAYTNSVYAFFRNLFRDASEHAILAPPRPPSSSVEYLSPELIDAKAAAVLAHVGYAGGRVPLEDICSWQAAEVGLRVKMGASPGMTEDRHGILGRISFNPLEIVVFENQNADVYRGRQRFTLAHELGHHFLNHGEHMSAEYCEEADFERDAPPSLGIGDIQKMEWQANHFASSLLLPMRQFVADFFDLAEEHALEDRGHGMLFVDDQRCNQRNFFRVTDSLRFKYDVSRSAVEIRLKKFGLLKDARQEGLRRL